MEWKKGAGCAAFRRSCKDRKLEKGTVDTADKAESAGFAEKADLTIKEKAVYGVHDGMKGAETGASPGAENKN